MAKPPATGAAGNCYELIGWSGSMLPESRGFFATLAGAQADIPNINHQDNVIILGPLPVAQIVQGSLKP